MLDMMMRSEEGGHVDMAHVKSERVRQRGLDLPWGWAPRTESLGLGTSGSSAGKARPQGGHVKVARVKSAKVRWTWEAGAGRSRAFRSVPWG